MKAIQMIVSMGLSAEDMVLSTLDEIITAYDRAAKPMKGEMRQKLFDVCILFINLQTEFYKRELRKKKLKRKKGGGQ